MFILRIFFFALVLASNIHATDTTKIIMIDPAGDAKNTGRHLHGSLERAETYKCALELKTSLEKQFSNVRVILTRAPGDEIVPLQNASFANRLDVDFFIRLQLYHEYAEKPKIYLYQLIFDPILDMAHHAQNQITFIPVQQAHFQNIKTTTLLTEQIKSALSTRETQISFDCYGVYGLPIKPLVGIIAPAITVEMGLLADNNWQLFISPLVEGIKIALSLNT
jgi:hypothetical protein